MRQRLFKVVITTFRARTLFLHVIIAGDFNENLLGRLSGNAGYLIDDANRLIQAATHSRRSRQVVNAPCIFGVLQVSAISRVNLFLESKIIVVKYLHKHHGASTTPIRIRVTFTQDIHDGFLTKLSVDLKPGEEFSRETAPAGETLLANCLNLLVVKPPAAGRPILLLKFFPKNRPILEKRAPQDNLLNHRVISLGDFLYPENILGKENVR